MSYFHKKESKVT